MFLLLSTSIQFQGGIKEENWLEYCGGVGYIASFVGGLSASLLLPSIYKKELLHEVLPSKAVNSARPNHLCQ